MKRSGKEKGGSKPPPLRGQRWVVARKTHKCDRPTRGGYCNATIAPGETYSEGHYNADFRGPERFCASCAGLKRYDEQ